MLCAWLLATTAGVESNCQGLTAQQVDVGGRSVHVEIGGTSAPGRPTVIFENGLGSPLSGWGTLPSAVAQIATVMAYECAGVFQSAAARQPRTPANLVGELHALLAAIKASPPYLLVGHSYGGALIHLFATTYPTEVAGLVYIDPTNFMQTVRDLDEAFGRGGAPGGRKLFKAIEQRLIADVPAGIKAEAVEAFRLEDEGYADFRARGKLPPVPISVLLAGRIAPLRLPAGLVFPGNFDRFSAALIEQRVAHFSALANESPDGILLLTSRNGHAIHRSEPDLVLGTIKRVLDVIAAGKSQK